MDKQAQSNKDWIARQARPHSEQGSAGRPARIGRSWSDRPRRRVARGSCSPHGPRRSPLRSALRAPRTSRSPSDNRAAVRLDGGLRRAVLGVALRNADHDDFHHEALLYADEDEFLAGTVPFVRDGVWAGEPVLVAVRPDRADGAGGRARRRGRGSPVRRHAGAGTQSGADHPGVARLRRRARRRAAGRCAASVSPSGRGPHARQSWSNAIATSRC